MASENESSIKRKSTTDELVRIGELMLQLPEQYCVMVESMDRYVVRNMGKANGRKYIGSTLLIALETMLSKDLEEEE